MEHYKVKSGPLGGRYVIAKLGKMRKAREWLVQATSDDRIIVQGNYLEDGRTECATGAIGMFGVDGKGGRLCTQGGYFPHLSIAKPFEFPAEFVRTCLDICQPLGSETTESGVTVMHTVEVVR